MQLILASSSASRKELINRLQYPFTSIKPDIDETRKNAEPFDQYCLRLAFEKAYKVQSGLDKNNNAVIVGCDSIAYNLDIPFEQQQALGKPHTKENAIAMLESMKGKKIGFITGLCVLKNEKKWEKSVLTEVTLRSVTREEIIYYLDIDQPYQCAGSFKSETLGIALCQSVIEPEPGALMGLPMLSLSNFLMEAKIPILG